MLTSRPAAVHTPVAPPPDVPTTTQPASAPAEPASLPETRPARDPNRVQLEVTKPTDPQDGWLVIESIKPGAGRAAATAVFLPLDNRIVIDTERVQRFKLDLSELDIRWEKRVVIRIDKLSAELTRKNWPVVHFEVTPAGDWIVVDPNRP